MIYQIDTVRTQEILIAVVDHPVLGKISPYD